MDTLARWLDTSYNKDIQYWQHLAYRQDVSDDKIMALKCQSRTSRSEALFQVLPTIDPNLSIATLIYHLKELQMNNVVKCLQDLKLDGK